MSCQGLSACAHCRTSEVKTIAFACDAVSATGAFEGYASVFEVEDGGHDVVAPGAFARSLAEKSAAEIRMLWHHDPTQPIGRWTELIEDSYGLFVRGQLVLEVAQAREAYALLRAGALDGLSIGFRTVSSRTDERTGVRRLLDVDLWEISLVTFPMNEDARIRAKDITTIRAYERFLRDAGGFSRAQARALAAHGFKALTDQRDAGSDEAAREELVARIRQATAWVESAATTRFFRREE